MRFNFLFFWFDANLPNQDKVKTSKNHFGKPEGDKETLFLYFDQKKKKAIVLLLGVRSEVLLTVLDWGR